MKAWLVGDLHGINPDQLNDILIKTNFDFKENTLVVAGDITDGYGWDNSLISYLRTIPNLIAVKGNHDVLTRPFNTVRLSEDNKKWLNDLPYQVETEHFYLAHGIWADEKIFPLLSENGFRHLSLRGCPILLGLDAKQWNISDYVWKKSVASMSLENYSRHFIDKPLILGHFWPRAIKEKGAGIIGLKTDENGLYDYKDRIYWVDPDINRQLNDRWYAELSRIKIMEF